MKRLNRIIGIAIFTAIICSGCGKSDSGKAVKNNNSVDVVLQREIDKSAQEEKSVGDTPSISEGVSNSSVVGDKQESQADNNKADSNVDIDISVMSSDMVYATVFQLMSEPDKYVGKTIKIKGKHYSSFYEPTGLTYHYVVIQDATACCAQGLEFELTQGLEYPAEGAEVVVIGTFGDGPFGMRMCTLALI